jgi:hypothetical protein
MAINRRSLVKLASAAPIMSAAPRFAWAVDDKPDYVLRIATGLVELAPEHIVSTTLYNDQFPGPLLRFKQGRHVVVDVPKADSCTAQMGLPRGTVATVGGHVIAAPSCGKWRKGSA